MHTERLANLLGATALAVSDKMIREVTARTKTSPSASAALVVLLEGGPKGVTELGGCLGLTQSAATRTLDSLESAGLVRRTRAGRTSAVALTATGRRRAATVLRARTDWLADLTATLDEADRAHLDRILGTLLTRVYDEIPAADLLCRLCDRRACTHESVCPVGQAERDRSG
ncbi:MarR family winged helix-turn-helix transcriptional regulator [Nocardia blacklockiae]|uniref:MarR family winged helix-turn-helix transcriptional regulator n=1 Tax=Nocardia blacklockiae TaxID=480036 RepID=UPI001893FC81|nr:MarR family winged helix-turn-helix transcriptional regulator [Nocardia blacklockiae]MBF6173560.1 winged helix-turn-helix transcriptional regulator [Nocardia blacklockiae]